VGLIMRCKIVSKRAEIKEKSLIIC